MRTRRWAVSAALVAVAGLVFSCCTFGNLAGYDIATCNPGHQSQVEDECDALNHGDTDGCTPFQCDKGTQHCVRRTRDDDRDGNPPSSCGGTDCDDHDALNGGSVEICDGHDNNCNGLIDDGIDYVGSTPMALLQSAPNLGSPPDPSITADSLGVVASVVVSTMQAAECVDSFGLDSTSPGALLGQNAACSFLSDAAQRSLSPQQPTAKRLSNGTAGTALAFVETSGCVTPGTLGYRWFEPPGSNGAFDLPCPNGSGTPANGVALPTLEDLGVQNLVTVLFYDVAIASRTTDATVTGCASLSSAPLDAMVMGYGSSSPGSIIHVTDGIATAAPGTLSIPGVGALVGAPVEATSAAAIFLITSDGKATHLAGLADFANARAIGLASGQKDDAGNIPIAVVGELGCAPQTLVVAFGSFRNGAPPTLSIQPAITVMTANAGHRAIRPAVAWQHDAPIGSGTRSEWLVTWTVDGPAAMARRYAASGDALSNAFDLGQGIVGAVPASNGLVYTIAASPTSFESLSLQCPTQ